MEYFFGTKILIPAAGYGRRLGSPAAKELLSLSGSGKTLIEEALDLVASFGFSTVVITRKDKVEVIAYFKNKKQEERWGARLELLGIDFSSEWPDTLLKSQHLWGPRNLVLLPDTVFRPQNILAQMDEQLKVVDAVFATHVVDDGKNWVVIQRRGEDFWLCEKPQGIASAQAWGLFVFQKHAGQILLQNMLESTFDHQWRKLPSKVQFLELEGFRDLARGEAR